MPDRTARERLWRQANLSAVPTGDDLDLEFLARTFTLAGGDIRNAALEAAFLAAPRLSRSGCDLVRAVARLRRQQGKLPSAAEFEDYVKYARDDDGSAGAARARRTRTGRAGRQGPAAAAIAELALRGVAALSGRRAPERAGARVGSGARAAEGAATRAARRLEPAGPVRAQHPPPSVVQAARRPEAPEAPVPPSVLRVDDARRAVAGPGRAEGERGGVERVGEERGGVERGAQGRTREAGGRAPAEGETPQRSAARRPRRRSGAATVRGVRRDRRGRRAGRGRGWRGCARSRTRGRRGRRRGTPAESAPAVGAEPDPLAPVAQRFAMLADADAATASALVEGARLRGARGSPRTSPPDALSSRGSSTGPPSGSARRCWARPSASPVGSAHACTCSGCGSRPPSSESRRS